MNRKLKRALAVAAVGALIGSTAAACATTAEPDYLVIQYDKGANGGLKYKDCIQPSHKGPGVVNDQNVVLPVNLRTWYIKADGTGDSTTPITTGTKPDDAVKDASGDVVTQAQPGPDVDLWTQADFYLNTDCTGGATSPIVQFWEKTGRRYQVSKQGSDDDISDYFNVNNFKTMLQNTLVAAEEKAARTASRQFDADDLDTNANGVWARLETLMSTTFTTELTAKLGGANYFCGAQFQRGTDGTPVDVKWDDQVADATQPTGYKTVPNHGTCPPVHISIQDVNYHDPSIAAARASAYAAQQNARAAQINAQSQLDTANKLKQGGAEAAKIQEQNNELQIEKERTKQIQACSQANRAVCVVGGGGAGVNVNAGG